MVKNLPDNAGDVSLIPGLGRFCWRRKWQPTPVFLPGKSHGWRSLAGCSPWGHKGTCLSDFTFTRPCSGFSSSHLTCWHRESKFTHCISLSCLFSLLFYNSLSLHCFLSFHLHLLAEILLNKEFFYQIFGFSEI